MKIVITWLHKNGKCRSWTNATPCEQVSMCLSAYDDAINRLEKTSGMTTEEIADVIADAIKKSVEERKNEQRNTF